jgi:hypothetical protein
VVEGAFRCCTDLCGYGVFDGEVHSGRVLDPLARLERNGGC